MLQVLPEIDPWMPCSFPDRIRRCGKRGISKRTDRDAKVLREAIGFPIHGCAAFRTEMHSELSTLLPVPDIHPAGPFRSNLGSLEIGTNPIWCTGSPLALLAMAGGDECGLAGSFNP